MSSIQTPSLGAPGVFKTPHATEANRVIAEKGLALLTEVGSTMHGVSSSDTGDDIDEMGICLEPPTHVIGLARFEQYEYRTKPVGARSGPGDIDRTVYSLRKFVRLAAQGNPTVLMALYSQPEMVRYCNWVGESLRANHDMFHSRQVGKRFLGYLDGQRKKLTGELSPRTRRDELIARYGYDTKYAYHAMRLAIQGRQLLTAGRIHLPMLAEHREYLLGVRTGALPTLADAIGVLDGLTAQLESAVEESRLPDAPDHRRIDDWLVSTYDAWWRQNDLT